jgi:hypothetical protein
MNRSTLDIGLDALTATDSGAGTAVAVMGAMVVGAAAVGMAKRLNEWGETAAQEKARVEAEQRYDAIEAGKPPKKAHAPANQREARAATVPHGFVVDPSGVCRDVRAADPGNPENWAYWRERYPLDP